MSFKPVKIGMRINADPSSPSVFSGDPIRKRNGLLEVTGKGLVCDGNLLIENGYQAHAIEELVKDTRVVILDDGTCRKVTPTDVMAGTKIYAVIDSHVKAGDAAWLAGDDTVFHVQEPFLGRN